MKRLLLVVGIAVGMSSGVALAQDKMPDGMPAGKKMPDGDQGKSSKTKKGAADTEKKQPPKSEDPKHKGHTQP